MMRRYHTGLTLIASITVILLLLWGLDLSHSIAQEPPAGSYRADVNVCATGPFLNVLQKSLAANHRDPHACIIIFRSTRGTLIWAHDTLPGKRDSDQIHLSHQADASSAAGCVVLVTFRAPYGADDRPGNRLILIHEILMGCESSPRAMTPTRLGLPVSYRSAADRGPADSQDLIFGAQ